MAVQRFVLGVDGEEAEQRATAIAFITHAHAAEICTTGGHVKGFVIDALGGELLIRRFNCPTPEKMAIVSACHSCAANGKQSKACNDNGFALELVLMVQHDELPISKYSPKILAHLRQLRWFAISGAALMVAYTGFRAFGESLDSSNFPEALAVKVEQLPVIFPVHMVAGALALFLVPLTYFLRGTIWHKWIGRVTAADVFLAGITAIPVATFQPVTSWSGAGFTAQAIIWMTLLTAGIWNIRLSKVAAHQACMVMMAAVTSGAVFFRIYLALWAALGSQRQFRIFYAFDSWVAWSLPLMITAAVIYIRPLAAKRTFGPS